MNCENRGRELENILTCEVGQKENKKINILWNSNQKLFKKILPLIAILLGIVIIITAIFSIINKEISNQGITYIKDGNIYVSNFDDLKPQQLTNYLVADYWNDSELGHEIYATDYSTVIKFSPDGRYVLYPDRANEDAELDLYCKDLKNEEVYHVDYGVSNFFDFGADGKIYYLRRDDSHSLYSYDFNDNDKIQSNINSFVMSSDKSKLLAIGNEMIYFANLQNSNSLEQIYFGDYTPCFEKATENLSKILIQDSYNVFCFNTETLTSEIIFTFNEKNSNNIIDETIFNDDGTAYFITRRNKEIPVSKFIKDEYAQLDSNIQKPNKDDYLVEKFDDFFGWTSVNPSEEYYEKREEYYNAQDRIEFRTEIADETVIIEFYDLYYYDGTETRNLYHDKLGIDIACVNEDYSISAFYVQPELVLPVYEIEDVKYSGAQNIKDECQEIPTNIIRQDFDKIHVFADGKVGILSGLSKYYSEIYIDDAYGAVVIRESSEYGTDALYTVSIRDLESVENSKSIYTVNDEFIEPPQFVDTTKFSFSYGSIYSTLDKEPNGTIYPSLQHSVYYEDDNAACGYEQTVVEHGVYDVKFFNYKDASTNYETTMVVENFGKYERVFKESTIIYDDSIVFLSDIREGSVLTGNLNLINLDDFYGDRESIELGKNVYSYQVFDTDCIVFIANYNSNTKKGDLFCYNGKKTILLDTEVKEIIPRYINKASSFDNYYCSNLFSWNVYGIYTNDACVYYREDYSEFYPFNIFEMDKLYEKIYSQK